MILYYIDNKGTVQYLSTAEMKQQHELQRVIHKGTYDKALNTFPKQTSPPNSSTLPMIPKFMK